jgi:endonuclease/exonuclease/phosphatase family metal-dependent hydrolase
MTNIKVLSFNILAENCVDFINPAEYYPHINPKELRIAYRLPRIVKKLKEHSADVVLLQEATYEVRDKLVKLLPEYKFMPYTVNNLQDPKAEHWGQLTLLKKCVFSNIKHDIKYLNKTPTAFSITTCKLCPRDKVIIVNMHLDAYDGKVRRAESTALLKWLTPHMKDHLVIIGGDFNTDDSVLHKKYSKFTPAIEKKNASSTYLCEKPMIDYIYVKGLQVEKGFIDDPAYCVNGKCGKEKTPQCMKGIIKSLGSDHNPIILEANIEPQYNPPVKKVVSKARSKSRSKSPAKRKSAKK